MENDNFTPEGQGFNGANGGNEGFSAPGQEPVQNQAPDQVQASDQAANADMNAAGQTFEQTGSQNFGQAADWTANQNAGQTFEQNNNQNFNQNAGQNYGQADFNTVYEAEPVRNSKGYSIASMVCGICSIVFCWCYGIPGLVLGIVALALAVKVKNDNGGVMDGMAKAGLVCGVIGAVLSALCLVYMILCVLGVFVTGLGSGLAGLDYYM